MRRVPLRALVEAGILIALGTVLSMYKIYRLPQGGSVTAGAMIPILLIGLRWGPRLGLPAGAAYGLARWALGGYVVHPVQFLLDYPIAYGALGLAGFFRRHPVAGVAVGITGRFVSSLTAGAVFFGQYAPAGQNPWVYSAAYNASYLVPEMAISMALMWLLSKTTILRPQAGPAGNL